MEGYFLHKVFQENMVLVTEYSRKGKTQIFIVLPNVSYKEQLIWLAYNFEVVSFHYTENSNY